MMPVLCSLGCEWLLCLAVFQACWWCIPSTLRWWVAAMPCCVSSLLMMLVLCSPGCEWLLCLALSQAFWSCLSSSLQEVSDYCALLCFKHDDDTCLLLSRKWVTAVPCCVSSLLMMPVLCSPVCKWLLCLVVFQVCWWCLSSALQGVSGCCALLCLKPANAYLFSREWVSAMPCCVSSLLMMSILCSPVCG